MLVQVDQTNGEGELTNDWAVVSKRRNDGEVLGLGKGSLSLRIWDRVAASRGG